MTPTRASFGERTAIYLARGGSSGAALRPDARLVQILFVIACTLFACHANADVLDPNDFSSLGTLNLASGNITIDTDTLTISGAVNFNGVAGNQGGLADSFGGAAGPLGIPEIAVFTFDDISLTGTTSITVTGTRALALLSRSNVTIDVLLSVNGEGDGAGVSSGALNGGPGGFAGGLGSNNGVGPGGGGYSSSAALSGASGASGGFGSDGRDGLGFGVQGVGGSSYGDLFGEFALQGGSGGGGANNDLYTLGGGGGGGALEVGALGFVNIGANGALEADGGAGDFTSHGGGDLLGGGGSGGAILVNAARLDNQGSINARGGDNVQGQREGGGGRVFIPAPDTTVVAGEPVSISGLLTGIDVSPGDTGIAPATLNQGVVTVLPELTIVPSGVTYNLDSFSPVIMQTATTTQPGLDVIAGNIQVTGTGEVTISSAHGIYYNSYSIELRSSAASITGGGLSNLGELSGTGTVDAYVYNFGEINTTHDQLTFTVRAINERVGQVNAINSTLSFPGDGIPSSLGGDNSDGLTNFGDLTLVGTTVNGDVHSPAGSNIYVGGTGVVFNGLVSGGANFPGVGAVTLNGGYAPGDSPAQVDLGGDVILGNGNTLFVELGGTTPGSFDQLLITGDVQLAGNLDVELLAPFSLSLGQHFAIIGEGGTLNGAFNGLSEGDLVGNFGGVDLFISYQNGVMLFTVPEPNALALFAVGVFGLLVLRRRARANR